jgi:PAS domain S-box-containing protein
MSAAESHAEKNVLILYSFSDRSVFAPPEVLENAVRTGVPWTVTFYIEYLEGRRFEKNAAYEDEIVEHLQNAYAGKRFDLVIVASNPALQFAIRHRDELFPSTPIVFMEVAANRIAGDKMSSGVTGTTIQVDLRATIDLALHLHPNTTTVAVVTEDSPFELYWLGQVHAELLRRDKLKEVDLVGLPPDELLRKVAALPLHTIVMFDEAPQEGVDLSTGPYQLLASIGRRFPTYCIFPTECLDHGGIGGVDYDVNQQSLFAAALSQRVLAGERPENIPVIHDPSHRARLDSRQLHYWNISESALPPGSQILYREATFWERERSYIIAAVVIIVIQSLSIVGLMMQRARKRKAEAGLRESEQRFRVMADTTPSLIWMCDQDGQVSYLNDRRLAFTGGDPHAGYGDTWTAYVHPDDLQPVLDSISQALIRRGPFSKEYRLRRNDGSYRWMFDVASPRLNGDGSFAGFIGSAIDITDQKLAQEALENVSGKLIEAQEKERSRIARDLHDDICQRLALLSMELEQANRNGAPPSTKKQLEQIRQHCSEITGDIQSLSHQLHSSKLEYLGIVAAVRGFCKEFAKQHDINVEFTEENVPAQLPKDVALCLFRVSQEALHNAVKYSGAERFTVQLRGTQDEVQLVVSDTGVGFNVDEAKSSRGLGLVSMQERVHLVHGRFFVESKPGAGTKITAMVPVSPAHSGLTEAETDQPTSATGTA